MSVDNSLHHQNLSNVLYSSDFSRFSTLGENIIVGPGNMSPQQLEAAWMNSAPHRANVLNRNYNVVGIGVFYGPDGRVWSVVDFGAISDPRGPTPGPPAGHTLCPARSPRANWRGEVCPDPSSPIR